MQISVVIPSYNSAAFIEKALLSVCQQSYRQFELIISDDGSSDNTLQIAKTFLNKYSDIQHQLLANQHTGASGARNSGIQAAQYDWVAFLDSDDYWAMDKLEKSVTALQVSQANVVFHNEIFFEDNTEQQHPVDYVGRYDPSISPFLALFRKNFLSPSSIVLAKSLLLDVGMFDTELQYAEDYDCWLKIALLPDINLCPLDEYLTYYFVRTGSLTSNTKARLHGLLIIFERYQKDVQRLSVQANKELKRFKGIAYSRCGWAYWQQYHYVLGILYIIKGLFLYPRLTMIKKLKKVFLS